MRSIGRHSVCLAMVFSTFCLAQATDENLYKAVQSGQLDILKANVEAGGDLSGIYPLRNGEMGTLLHVAVEEDQIEVVNYLLDKGLLIESRTVRSPAGSTMAGQTPLTIAAGNDAIKIVELLIERGACLEPYNSAGLPILHPSITSVSYRVKQCIESAQRKRTRTLATAAWKSMIDADGKADKAKLLDYLANGGACEGTDEMGNTVLHHLAALSEEQALLQVLKQNVVDINAVNTQGQTALHAAAKMYNTGCIQKLLEQGANVNARDIYGHTPLLMFGSVTSDLKGISQAFNVLIENGADIKATNVFGRNILFQLLGYPDQHAEGSLLVLKAGADVNCQDNDGETPLQNACDAGELEVVRLLLEHGANPDLKNIDGRGPECFVRYEKQQDIWNLLFARKKDVTVQQAVYYNQTDIVKKLIPQGKTIDDVALYGDPGKKQLFSYYDFVSFNQSQTCLIIASVLDDPTRIDLVLSFGADVDGTDSSKNTALHWAAHGGCNRAVEALLKAGADIALKNSNGKTAYDLAVGNNSKRAAQLIRDVYPDIVSSGDTKIASAPSQQPQPADNANTAAFEADLKNAKLPEKVKQLAANSAKPLHTAVILNKPEFVRTVVQKEPALANEPDTRGILPIGYAAVLGYPEMVKLLVENGADINGIDHAPAEILGAYPPRGHTVDAETGWGILHYLVMNDDIDMLKFIIAQKADLEVKDREQGMSPFILAMELERYETAKALAAAGADINQFDKRGNAAIHSASRGKHADRIELLLSLGVAVDARNRGGSTPLMMAAAWQSNDLIVSFVERGANVNAADNSGNNALHAAASNDDIYETVRILLEYGVDVNHRNNGGRTPVFSMCCDYCNMGPKVLESARLMFQSGADLSVQDQQGDTVLHEAIRNSKLEFAAFLIDQGVNVNALNKKGVSAVRQLLNPTGFISDKEIALDVLKKMVEKGADLSTLDDQGRTVLHDILKREWMPVFSYLVEKGAPINAQDKYGSSVLHMAVENSNIEAVEILVAAGADVNLQDKKQNSTPLHLAIASGNAELVKMLLDAGARTDIPDRSNQTAVDRSKYMQDPAIQALLTKGA